LRATGDGLAAQSNKDERNRWPVLIALSANSSDPPYTDKPSAPGMKQGSVL